MPRLTSAAQNPSGQSIILRAAAVQQQHWRRPGVTELLVGHLDTRRADIQGFLLAHRHIISLTRGMQRKLSQQIR
jgi:hypothetical protein